MAEMSPLRRRMIEDMTIRNLSPATQQSYLYAVSKFSRHFGRSPDRLGVEDVRAYQDGVERLGMVVAEPGRLRAAVFLRRDLGQSTIAGADSLSPASRASFRPCSAPTRW